MTATRVFFDDFESYTPNALMPFTKWRQDDYRDPPFIVTAASDSGAGPYSGTQMARLNDDGTVAYNVPGTYSTCALTATEVPYTNEVFYRVRFRIDANFTRTDHSSKKFMRVFQGGASFLDIYSVCDTNITGGIRCEITGNVFNVPTYFGGNGSSGDHSSSSTGWHLIEWYFNSANGATKIWQDSVLVINTTDPNLFSGKQWLPFYLTSNYADAHPATNYIYVDNVEVFTDSPTGVATTGLMSDASISVGSAPLLSAPLVSKFRPR